MATETTPEPEPDDTPDPDVEPNEEPEPDPESAQSSPTEDDIPAADRVKRGDDAATKARKWERQANRDREARAAIEEENRRLREAGQTADERALSAAKEQARAEALGEVTPRMKALALENAVTKHAAVKGVTIGDGDDAKTVRFLDPDDVQMWLERQIRAKRIDEQDIYDDDGTVNDDGLMDALVTLAVEKPTWLAGASNGTHRLSGDADGGKGRRPKNPDSLTVEEHMRHIQKSHA